MGRELPDAYGAEEVAGIIRQRVGIEVAGVWPWELVEAPSNVVLGKASAVALMRMHVSVAELIGIADAFLLEPREVEVWRTSIITSTRPRLDLRWHCCILLNIQVPEQGLVLQQMIIGPRSWAVLPDPCDHELPFATARVVGAEVAENADGV